jgi:hypothetical protein
MPTLIATLVPNAFASKLSLRNPSTCVMLSDVHDVAEMCLLCVCVCVRVCVCVCVCGVVGTSVVTVNVVIVSVVLVWSVSGRDSKCRDGQSHSWCTSASPTGSPTKIQYTHRVIGVWLWHAA